MQPYTILPTLARGAAYANRLVCSLLQVTAQTPSWEEELIRKQLTTSWMYQPRLGKTRTRLFPAKAEPQSRRLMGSFTKRMEETLERAESGLAPEAAKNLTGNNVELRLRARTRKWQPHHFYHRGHPFYHYSLDLQNQGARRIYCPKLEHF